MTRRAVLLGVCAVAVLGNLSLAAVAFLDMRRACPDGAQCGDASASLLLFAGLAVAFCVASALVWRGQIQ